MKLFKLWIFLIFLNLTNAQDIKFLSEPFIVTQFAGFQVSIPGCKVTSSNGDLNVTAFWFKNGSRIKNAVITPTMENNTFVFSSFFSPFVTFTDEGVYQCGINLNESQLLVSAEISLIVKEITVKFVKNPTAIESNEKNRIALSGCAYESTVNLNANAYWLINGNRKIKTAYWSGGSSPYHFPYMQIYEKGYYQCGLYDPFRMKTPVLSGNASVTYFQANIGNPRLITIPEYASDAFEIEGCLFSFSTGLRIQAYWYKDGVMLSVASYDLISNNNYKFKNFKISRSSLKDAGHYQCRVINNEWLVKTIESRNVTITLKPVEVFFTTSPKIIHTKRGIQVTGCSYNTSRHANVSSFWHVNGAVRIIQADVSKNNNSYAMSPLNIDSYDLIGWYKCVVFDNNIMLKAASSKNTTVLSVESPKLITQPELVSSTETILIVGSKIFSLVPPKSDEIYWLKNDVQKVKAAFTHDVNEPSVYQISNINESRKNYETQGWYQTVLRIPGYPQEIKTDIVEVQFQDLSHTRITIATNQPSQEATNDVETTKTDIESEIKRILDDNGDTNSSTRLVQVVSLGSNNGKLKIICRILYKNISKTERLSYCGSFDSIFTVDTLSKLQVTKVDITYLDCCLPLGNDVHTMSLVFKNVSYFCGNNTESVMYSTCLPNLRGGPRWSNTPQLGCSTISATTRKLVKLEQVNICTTNVTSDCSPVEEVSRNLSSITTNPDFNLTAWQDIAHIDTIITSIVSTAQSSNITRPTEVFNDIIDVADVLFDEDVELIITANVNNGTSTSILKSLEAFADIVGSIVNGTNEQISISRKNIGVSVARLKKRNVTVVAGLSKNGTSFVAIGNKKQISMDNPIASIQIPEESFKNPEDVVYSYHFQKDILFLSESAMKNSTKTVQSIILSATVGHSRITNLKNPIKMSFQKSKILRSEGIYSCQFWDFNKGTYGGWSAKGCWTIVEERDQKNVTCACNHLTNFALLFDVAQSGNNPKELQIITWIGCGVSLAGMFLTTVTYLFFRNLHKKLPPKILISLCISLMGLLIVFLAGVDQTSADTGCKVVASLLQYFLLATFCWMSIEAVNLYRCFIQVFVGGGNANFMYKASLYAWGLPLVIVGATAGIQPDNLGNETACIVHGNSFYFGILLPAGIILLFNLVILIAVIRKLSRTNMKKGKSGENRTLLGQVKVAFVCSLLVGITWIFGALAVGRVTMFFQWLFCIFNSFQGLYIFIFYMVRSQDVKREVKRLFNPATYNGSSYSSTMKTLRRGQTHLTQKSKLNHSSMQHSSTRKN